MVADIAYIYLIADILGTTNLENIEGYLLPIDFENTFDFLNHNWLIVILEKYGFGHDITDWIKILLKKQKSYVMNLKHDECQGDPISP